MKATRIYRKIVMIVLAAWLLAVFSVSAFAQCAMCKVSVTKAGDVSLARSLNQGIIVLLIPPVAIFCAIFITAVKHRKALGENQPQSSKENLS